MYFMLQWKILFSHPILFYSQILTVANKDISNWQPCKLVECLMVNSLEEFADLNYLIPKTKVISSNSYIHHKSALILVKSNSKIYNLRNDFYKLWE